MFKADAIIERAAFRKPQSNRNGSIHVCAAHECRRKLQKGSSREYGVTTLRDSGLSAFGVGLCLEIEL